MEAIINKPNVVKLMREIRDQFSLDIMNMSFEEQKKIHQNNAKGTERKKKKQSLRQQ